MENLFKKIEIEQKGQLDILVNAAFKGGNVFDLFFISYMLKIYQNLKKLKSDNI